MRPRATRFAVYSLLIFALFSLPYLNAQSLCQNGQCDALSCNLKYEALKLCGRISPGCASGQRTKCDSEMDAVAAALQLGNGCGLPTVYRVSKMGNQSTTIQGSGGLPGGTNTIFVSPSGSDAKDGLSRATALQTISAALFKTRGMSRDEGRTIVLMAGKHRLVEPVSLDTRDSFTTIQGETGAILSGAVDVSSFSWIRGPRTTSALVSNQVAPLIGPLSSFSSGPDVMGIRAQHPNKINYLDNVFQTKSRSTRWIKRPSKVPFAQRLKVQTSNQLSRFQYFLSTSQGPCASQFSPPTGYFCEPFADADGVCGYSVPGVVTFPKASRKAIRLDRWTNRSTGYLNVLHYMKWGGWSFQIENCPRRTPRTSMCLSQGGFQSSRGDCGKGGSDWFVENIIQLLDAPNEFFIDFARRTIEFIPPTGAPFSGKTAEVGSQIRRLIEVKGTSSNPVRSVSINNVVFERTYSTHMDSHEMPSGGGWTLHRGGAVFLEGVEDVQVKDCSFKFLGSNGLFVSKYARNVSITRNTFYALEGSAILLSGDPRYSSQAPWDRRSDVEWVEKVEISNNFISDIGLREFQAAGVFVSISRAVLIKNNVIFNGPRAGIILNDHFGGRMDSVGNVLFNLVRTTLDHGPYNAWDRQKWLTPSGFWESANQVKGNFIIGNPNGAYLVDLDDATRNHVVQSNCLVSGFMKFKGYNNTASHNIVIANLQGQLACVEVDPGDNPQPKFSWKQNTCYGTGRVIPYVFARNQYCAKTQFETNQNSYFGLAPKINFGPCGTIFNWTTNHGQDLSSTFSSSIAQTLNVVAACSSLVQEYF